VTAAARRLPEPPPASDAWAYFLDFDGTLVDIAETPEAVAVGARLRDTLAALAAATCGAVALVSGRSLADLDRLVAPLRLPAAGLHGLELRAAADGAALAASPQPLTAGERAALSALPARHSGVLVEDKGAAVALHFRRAAAAEDDCLALAQALVSAAPGRSLLRGKMVVEVKLARSDKGEAVRRLMRQPPFAGRRPVFLGDDATDEDGFAATLALGGLAVRVGAGESRATCRLPGPAAALAWLAGAVAR